MPGILNRLALMLLSLTAVASQAQAGEVSADDWGKLHTALRAERWTAAVELTLDLLDRLPETALHERAQLRYTYLFALSGEVVTGDRSREELAERIEPLIGQEFILPGHLVADPATNGPMFNQIAKTDSDETVMVIAANADASSIHCFEYATLSAPVDLAAHTDDIGYLRGRLARIETNPSAAWAARVYLDDASIAFQPR
jgi:hypothetical protein